MTTLPIAGTRAILTQLRAAARPYRRAMLASVVVGLVEATRIRVVPIAIRGIVDSIATATRADLVVFAIVMLLATAGGAIATAISVRFATSAYNGTLATLREKLIATAMGLPRHTVESAGTGDLIARSSDDVSEIGDAAPRLIPAFTTAAFAVLVTVVAVTTVNPWYSLALLTMVPFWVVAVRWYVRTVPQLYRTQRNAMGDRAQQIIESHVGRDTIAGLGMTRQRHLAVMSASWAVAGHSLRARTAQNMLSARLKSAQYVAHIVTLTVGFLLVGAGLSTVGEVTAVFLIFMRLWGPLIDLLMVFDVVQSVAASLGRIVGVATMDTDDEPTAKIADGLHIEEVSFSYVEGEQLLHDVSFTVTPGQHIAIVGSSGAGKSTVAALAAGILRPDQGTIRRPAATMLLTQEQHQFNGTIRDNLTLAASDATDAEIHAACDFLGLGHLDLEAEMSASQTQMLALVRLVLADPELAILDEATQSSDLDRAARAALNGRTALVIAHRLSQAAGCDRIIVMENGRIAEDGCHDTLLHAGGRYAALWEAWQAHPQSEKSSANG